MRELRESLKGKERREHVVKVTKTRPDQLTNSEAEAKKNSKCYAILQESGFGGSEAYKRVVIMLSSGFTFRKSLCHSHVIEHVIKRWWPLKHLITSCDRHQAPQKPHISHSTS